MDVITRILNNDFPPHASGGEWMWKQSRVGPKEEPMRPANVYLMTRMQYILDKQELIAFLKVASDLRVAAIYTIWPKISSELANKIESNHDHLIIMEWEALLKNNIFAGYWKDRCACKVKDCMSEQLPEMHGTYTDEEIQELWSYARITGNTYLKMVPRTPRIPNLSRQKLREVELWRYITYDMYTSKDYN